MHIAFQKLEVLYDLFVATGKEKDLEFLLQNYPTFFNITRDTQSKRAVLCSESLLKGFETAAPLLSIDSLGILFQTEILDYVNNIQKRIGTAKELAGKKNEVDTADILSLIACESLDVSTEKLKKIQKVLDIALDVIKQQSQPADEKEYSLVTVGAGINFTLEEKNKGTSSTDLNQEINPILLVHPQSNFNEEKRILIEDSDDSIEIFKRSFAELLLKGDFARECISIANILEVEENKKLQLDYINFFERQCQEYLDEEKKVISALLRDLKITYLERVDLQKDKFVRVSPFDAMMTDFASGEEKLKNVCNRTPKLKIALTKYKDFLEFQKTLKDPSLAPHEKIINFNKMVVSKWDTLSQYNCGLIKKFCLWFLSLFTDKGLPKSLNKTKTILTGLNKASRFYDLAQKEAHRQTRVDKTALTSVAENHRNGANKLDNTVTTESQNVLLPEVSPPTSRRNSLTTRVNAGAFENNIASNSAYDSKVSSGVSTAPVSRRSSEAVDSSSHNTPTYVAEPVANGDMLLRNSKTEAASAAALLAKYGTPGLHGRSLLPTSLSPTDREYGEYLRSLI